jgi:hypothetical protein
MLLRLRKQVEVNNGPGASDAVAEQGAAQWAGIS